MAKAILNLKAQTGYKDIPGVRYHFGPELLDRAKAALGDQVIFYEPRRLTQDPNSRGGRLSYFATARIAKIVADEDPAYPNHHFAYLEDYIDFDRPVKFKTNGHYFESSLRKHDGSTNRGQAQQSIRYIPGDEFENILMAGFGAMLPDLSGQNPSLVDQDEEPLTLDRPLVEITSLKPFRDIAFRRSVRQAYDFRCAVTGLAIQNAKGNPEVHAAHIRPVSEKGSDSVRNGLALTGTAHWMFDQGLIAISDDMKVLTAQKLVPPKFLDLINENRIIHLPKDRTKWPHPAFLEYHRKSCFLG